MYFVLDGVLGKKVQNGLCQSRSNAMLFRCNLVLQLNKYNRFR